MPRSIAVLAITFGVAIILLVAWGAWQILRQPRQTPESATIAQQRAYPKNPPNVLPTDPFVGPTQSAVTVIAFMDFSCAPCAKGFELLEELHARVPDAKIVWKDLPDKADVVPQLLDAHIAARCSHAYGRFWDIAAYLFEKQNSLLTMDYSSLAEKFSLPQKPFAACLQSRAAKNAIAANRAQAETYGIFSTPFFFVNTRRIDGIVPINILQKAVIDAGV